MTRKYIIVADDSLKGFDEEIAKLEREWGAEEIEPCEDCISRQATVKKLCGVAEFLNNKREGLGSPYIMAALFIQDNKDEFPSVTPQRDNSVLDCVKMREPTAQERESIKRYIDSISVTAPLPKIGRWMDGTCSECGKTCLCDGWGIDIESKYCPSCGAKMEVSE